MDWNLFWMAFASIFLAEIGDKTQLGVLSFSASSQSPLTVFIAASLALIFATFIGSFAGSFISRWVPPKVLQIGSGILFIFIGFWTLLRK